MASPINTFPRGLLPFLGSQTGGRVPQELAGDVAPSLEMFPFYALASAEIVGDSTATVTAVLGPYLNTFGNLTVPEGEMWYVHEYCAESSLVMAAGETQVHSPMMFARGPVTSGNGFFFLNQNVSAAPGIFGVSRATAPFWMLPGGRLGVYLTSIVASSSTIAYVLRARVTKLKI